MGAEAPAAVMGVAPEVAPTTVATGTADVTNEMGPVADSLGLAGAIAEAAVAADTAEEEDHDATPASPTPRVAGESLGDSPESPLGAEPAHSPTGAAPTVRFSETEMDTAKSPRESRK